MNKFVYLAGPIAGQTEAQANDWRISVNSVLKYTGLVAVFSAYTGGKNV